MVRFLVFGLMFLIWPSFLLAVGSTFTISTAVEGQDTESPTTPTLLSVVPVAATQIDLIWSTATDNIMVAGYVILRDGSAVATTSLTSYSDTGLLPETLYEYSVYAFDSTLNLSTTSNQLSTTTLELSTSTPTTTPSGRPTPSRTIVLSELVVETTERTAWFDWTTDRPTRYVLRWGRTDTYNDGYIQSESYSERQSTLVTDLEPGTTYLYELEGYTPAGIMVVLGRGSFSTLSPAVPVVVPNVQRLEATVIGEVVTLNYQFPPGWSGATVRVVRNYLVFPSSINDGAVIYEGTGTVVRDATALNVFSPQYYSVFILADNGQTSSGAVIRVERPSQVPDGVETAPTILIPDLPPISVAPYELEQSEISVWQGNVRSDFATAFSLAAAEPFTLRIPYEAVSASLKVIIVTLTDPTDQRRTYSFLLRLNADRSAYEATVAPLGVIGRSRLQVEVYDFEQALIGRYQAPIEFRPTDRLGGQVIWPDAFIAPVKLIWPGLLMVGLLWLARWLWLLWRRREEKVED